MKRKRTGKRFLSVLGTALAAALAASALAAGSAQAGQWYVNGSPITKTHQFAHHPMTPGTLKMTVPNLGLTVVCNANGNGVISPTTKLDGQLWIEKCHVPAEEKCQQAKSNSITVNYSGTGEAINLSGPFTLEFESGKGCSLPTKTKVTIPSLALSYPPFEGETAYVFPDGSGSGTFGPLNPMTVSTHFEWLHQSGQFWSWH